MENNLTPQPEQDKDPDQIQAEMCETREALSQKLMALENQVVGTVQTASETMSGTVNAVKSLMTSAPEAVTDTVKQVADAVSEKMKQAFDISGHVRENPWATMSVSAGLGFLTGLLLFRERASAVAPAPLAAASYAPPSYTPPVAAATPSTPGVFDQLIDLVSKKLMVIGENVIESATAAVNDNVQHEVPKLVNAATEMAAERLTPDTSPASVLNGSGMRY